MTVTISAEYPASTLHRPTKVEVFLDDTTIDRITSAQLTGVDDLIRNVVGQLGAPGHAAGTGATPAPVHLVGDGTGQSLTVRVGDTDVAHTDYDESGYAGLDVLRAAVTAMAENYGIPVVSVDMRD